MFFQDVLRDGQSKLACRVHTSHPYRGHVCSCMSCHPTAPSTAATSTSIGSEVDDEVGRGRLIGGFGWSRCHSSSSFCSIHPVTCGAALLVWVFFSGDHWQDDLLLLSKQLTGGWVGCLHMQVTSQSLLMQTWRWSCWEIGRIDTMEFLLLFFPLLQSLPYSVCILVSVSSLWSKWGHGQSFNNPSHWVGIDTYMNTGSYNQPRLRQRDGSCLFSFSFLHLEQRK